MEVCYQIRKKEDETIVTRIKDKPVYVTASLRLIQSWLNLIEEEEITKYEVVILKFEDEKTVIERVGAEKYLKRIRL
jgi:hypothetical protein